eukprot:scaffold33188_cov63-Phaeocystis_antarctica.AAC.1
MGGRRGRREATVAMARAGGGERPSVQARRERGQQADGWPTQDGGSAQVAEAEDGGDQQAGIAHARLVGLLGEPRRPWPRLLRAVGGGGGAPDEQQQDEQPHEACQARLEQPTRALRAPREPRARLPGIGIV